MPQLNRRHILSVFGALTATAALPKSAFAQAPKMPDWHIGWQNPVRRQLQIESLQLVSGTLPADLSGTFYRNGPAIHERGGVRMTHWFDGDGMVQAFRIGGGQVSHIGRPVETALYKRNEKAGRFTVGGFGTRVADPYPLNGPDSANAANTSVLPVGDEVWALWEGGSAYRLDSETLETYGPKIWTEKLHGMPFSAHPKVDQKGHIWNFGQSVDMKALIIYKLNPKGDLLEAKLIKDVPPGMIHDFCVTDRHLIFVANSFRAVRKDLTYLGRFDYQKDAPQRVVVLDMDDLDNRRDYDLPPGFQFHFGNAYQETSGDIRFTLCKTEEDEFVSHSAKALMRGDLPEHGPTILSEVILKVDGKASLAAVTDNLASHDFPQFNPAFGGKAARYLYTVGNSVAGRPGETAILRHDLSTSEIDFYDYGPDCLVEEHVFISAANPKSEDDGYLIGTSLDYKDKVTRLNVLRADRISDGPAAVFELPYALPLGFHGAWKGA
jgi:carotenoid cleavage dioxygenase-like enzyme